MANLLFMAAIKLRELIIQKCTNRRALFRYTFFDLYCDFSHNLTSNNVVEFLNTILIHITDTYLRFYARGLPDKYLAFLPNGHI